MLPVYLPKRVENFCPHKNPHMDFIALLRIAKTWNQPRCPSIGKWINKLCYIQAIEYYWMLKCNELPHYEKMWRSFKCIVLSERNQSEKATYCMIPTLWYCGKDKTTETVKRPMIVRVWRSTRRRWEDHRGFLGQWKYSVWYHNHGNVPLFICQNHRASKSGP